MWRRFLTDVSEADIRQTNRVERSPRRRVSKLSRHGVRGDGSASGGVLTTARLEDI
jgi:hypothetical protein